ncbi:LysE family translocator [Variovorax arabinosiphilus]|uniref:LysE family translocator n=1 Tax=Variovorax arabinosiphilus TaxID=3053498 RepID=UPI0025755A39|nr:MULTISPECIES: LysE family translocator [unclassified Variovorax]MDM0122071.1 LysE family translocator [Variovorax sp. J2L1-78]MDM0131399.1 LysE family translocator [Variovorax sp. J2L1-63]MDM0234834.1 LysE family translocator [Variovorax sp. J2R1-6]
MPDTAHLIAFIVAGWLLNLTPGPDVLYIVSNALRSGVRAGIVAGLGITAGCFVHIVAAAVGVGTLLVASTEAFTVLKYLGAGYLLYLGARMLFAKPMPAVVTDAAPVVDSPRGLKAIFMGGFWTNVLNPKVALFFLAFVPQFIAPDASNKAMAFVLLGLLFNLNAIPVNTGWAVAAGWLARRGTVRQWMRVLDRVAGAMFIGFGIKLALSDNPLSSSTH